MDDNSAALIVNGRSRRGREWYEQVRDRLISAGLQLRVANLHKDPLNVLRDVKQAVDSGVPLVCVGGGDGTLSSCAKFFMNSEAVMGVIPLGTGNSLARDLGIKASVQDACDVILTGRKEDIDISDVNGDIFLNVSTIGLTSLIAENLDDRMKKRFGRAVYLFAMFKALARMRRFHALIEMPNQTLEFNSMQVVVGNGRYHAGPFPITPDASLESGYLAGYSVNTSRKGVLARYAMRLWRGSHIDLSEVVPFNATTINITTDPVKRIVVDGEVGLHTPALYKVHPQAIHVMVPKNMELEPPYE